MPGKANLIVAKRDDSIHFLIDCAQWVVCYNSSVGLLALLHGKPVITTGNAFYNYRGTGHRADSLSEAVRVGRVGLSPSSVEMITRLTAWFTFRKYSSFTATDVVREFELRKAHGYKDILVSRLRWDHHDIPLGRMKQSFPLSNRSYLWARIGMEPTAPKPKPTQTAPVKPKPSAPGAASKKSPTWGLMKRSIYQGAQIALRPTLNDKDRLRLAQDPIDFFSKAKWPPNQFFGRLLLDKSQRTY
jgi:hypothetical protein